MGTFSAQYPPTEWFNPRVVHLHSVATQTRAASPSVIVVFIILIHCQFIRINLKFQNIFGI